VSGAASTHLPGACYRENTQVSSPGQPPTVHVPTSAVQSPSGRVRKPGTVGGGPGAFGFANGCARLVRDSTTMLKKLVLLQMFGAEPLSVSGEYRLSA
jgi:hypothetical protein